MACHIYDSPNHILDIPLSRPKQKSLSSLPLRGPGTLDGSIGDGKPGAIRSEIEIIWNVNVPFRPSGGNSTLGAVPPSYDLLSARERYLGFHGIRQQAGNGMEGYG